MFDIVKQTYGKGNTKTARFEGANFKTGPNHKTLGHRSYVMATPSITDLQSLVNRLTADNNRLRNLVKLYEASFAAMKPGKYYVCSDDGEVSSSYARCAVLTGASRHPPPARRKLLTVL